MPVILKPQGYDQWLDAKEKDTGKLEKLLAPYPPEEMTAYKVSKSVNTPSNDSLKLIEKKSAKNLCAYCVPRVPKEAKLNGTTINSNVKNAE